VIEGLTCTDYALIRQTARERHDDEPDPAGWNGTVSVGPFVTLERIPSDDAGNFTIACSARGDHFEPTEQSPLLYTFVRRDAPQGASTWHWDPDEAIQWAIALSRFIRDNSHGTGTAVRTVEGWNAGHRQVAPLDIEARAFAYRVITDERDFLDDAEATELDRLVRTYYASRGRLPGRVTHALWLAEYMTQSRFIDVALIHVVTALEALLNTSNERASTQFVKRSRALASELSIDLSGTAANNIYELRSHSVHGVRSDLDPEGKEGRLMLLARAVLRAALRRAIENPDFAAIFASDRTIEARWPI
jgi:hypothetical protein